MHVLIEIKRKIYADMTRNGTEFLSRHNIGHTQMIG